MSKRRRNRGRAVDGIIIVDKLKGLSSNDVLQRVKRVFGAAKAGHTGSLDPLATGVLPICLGEATKFSQFLLESDKSYRTRVQLGVQTTTGDAEGEVVDQRPVRVTQADVEAVVNRFVGEVSQVPSMYSALKHNGQPLYKLAREGIEVERAARTVTVFRNELINFNGDQFELEVDCSKGTYIRTLVEDIGHELGCLAHVRELQRLKAGPYAIDQSYTLEALEAIKADGRKHALTPEDALVLERLLVQVEEAGRDSLEEDELHSLQALIKRRNAGGDEALDGLLSPMETAVSDWPEVMLGKNASFYLLQGQPVLVSQAPTSGGVRIYGQPDGSEVQQAFLGVGKILDDGRVAPKRLVRSFS